MASLNFLQSSNLTRPSFLPQDLIAPITSASAATTPTGSGGKLTDINDFIKSPLGQLILGTGFGALDAYGQSKQQQELLDKQIASNLQQTGASLTGAALQGQQNNMLQRELSTSTKLGEYQDYAKKQAMTPLVLAMMGQGYTPGNPRIAAAMGKLPTIPQDAAARLAQLSSPDTTAAAIYDYDRDRLSRNPNAAPGSINTYTPGADNTARQQALQLQQAQTEGRLRSANERQLSTLQQAVAQSANPQKKKSNTGSRLAKAGTSAGVGFATGGPLGAALGALTGLFG